MPRVLTISIATFALSAALTFAPTDSGNRCAASTTTTSKTTVTVACPFCSAIALTFSEQLNSTDIAVVAKLLEVPPPSDDPDADFPKAKFEILRILKGEKFVGEGMTFKTQLVGSYPEGQKFLVLGVDPPNVAWTTPMKASDRVFEYLGLIQKLPESGPERLVFFQDFFEDKESVLAFDAYDEFARAPYEDLIAMKDQMDREQLLGWVQDPETSVSRRRLYFTMLGVCGTKDDVKVLEDLITSGSRKKRAGLDALIASYLMLKGEAGVDLIEKTFLADHEVDYVDTLAAVSALRFHGTEVDLISKKRIVTAIRHLLDRPKMADMIIPDLARWEDWSVMERLVQMFKDADADSNWLRVPVITYLRACPKPEAKQYIEELRKIDPESVQRADFFLGVGDSDDEWDDEPEEKVEAKEKSDAKEKTDTNEEPEVEEKIDTETGAAKTADDLDLNVSNSSTKRERPESKMADNYVVKKVPLDQGTETFATEKDAAESNLESDAAQTLAGGPLPLVEAAESNVEPNPNGTTFVASTADSMAAQSAPVQVAQSVTETTPVAVATPVNMTWSIIFVPMAISVLIFLLLWSVVNGWFERLIF